MASPADTKKAKQQNLPGRFPHEQGGAEKYALLTALA